MNKDANNISKQPSEAAATALKAMTVLRSHAEAVQLMDYDEGSRLIRGIVDYGLFGVEPRLTTNEAKILWIAIKPNVVNSVAVLTGRSKGGKASKRNNPNGRRGKRDAEPPETADTPTATADALPPTADTSTAEPLNLPKGKVRKRDADVIAGQYESFLTSLFANANREAHTTTAERLGLSYEKFKAEAVAIVDEWKTTGQTHTGYNDAAKHVISLIRCRIEAEKRRYREKIDRICKEGW